MTALAALKAQFNRRRPAVLVASVWLLGLILGWWFVRAGGIPLVLRVRSASMKTHSFFFMLIGCATLYGSVALILQFFSRHWILCIVLMKALFFSASGFAISAAYQSAAWLIVSLLLFSDFWISAIFLWYCYRTLSSKSLRKNEFLVCFGVTILVISLDHFAVSPFLMMLFT